MAKKLGNDYRLWIESATPGTYNEIKGQTSMKVSRKSSDIDTSTKDDYPYGTQAPGLKTLTIDVELYPNLPDANGYTRFEAAAQGTNPVNFQIRKGGSSGTDSDAVFEASMYIGSFDSDFGKNDVVKCNAQLSLAAAPTTDELA